MPKIIPIFQTDYALTSLPPLSLYIHIPYCVRKCPYCDFNSHPIPTTLPENEYIDALILDLQQELPNVWGRKIHSIFIGGGTPALFQATYIEKLLNTIRSYFVLEPDAEITLEANPGVFEQDKFKHFHLAGITRLSLGVQSFSDLHLKQIGRIHSAQEAQLALEKALNIFPQVNIDIMYALPQQSVENAVNDINIAISSGVSHISAYQLTIEENTAFSHSPPKNLPNDELIVDIENAIYERLFQATFERYEISAFTKQEHFCKHNLNYWHFGDYIGIGAGAHGKISYHDKIERSIKTSHPKQYIQQIFSQEPFARRHTVASKDLSFEFMMNALRLNNGITTTLFSERTGLPYSVISNTIDRARQKGLLQQDENIIQTTQQGRLFLNELLTMFL